MFSKSIDYFVGSVLAYVASHSSGDFNHNGKTKNYPKKNQGGQPKGDNRGKLQYKCPLHCQICHEEGYYASNCWDRHTKSNFNAHLVEALENYTITSDTAYWYTDLGVSTHMTSDVSQLEKA